MFAILVFSTTVSAIDRVTAIDRLLIVDGALSSVKLRLNQQVTVCTLNRPGFAICARRLPWAISDSRSLRCYNEAQAMCASNLCVGALGELGTLPPQTMANGGFNNITAETADPAAFEASFDRIVSMIESRVITTNDTLGLQYLIARLSKIVKLRSLCSGLASIAVPWGKARLNDWFEFEPLSGTDAAGLSSALVKRFLTFQVATAYAMASDYCHRDAQWYDESWAKFSAVFVDRVQFSNPRTEAFWYQLVQYLHRGSSDVASPEIDDCLSTDVALPVIPQRVDVTEKSLNGVIAETRYPLELETFNATRGDEKMVSLVLDASLARFLTVPTWSMKCSVTINSDFDGSLAQAVLLGTHFGFSVGINGRRELVVVSGVYEKTYPISWDVRRPHSVKLVAISVGYIALFFDNRYIDMFKAPVAESSQPTLFFGSARLIPTYRLPAVYPVNFTVSDIHLYDFPYYPPQRLGNLSNQSSSSGNTTNWGVGRLNLGTVAEPTTSTAAPDLQPSPQIIRASPAIADAQDGQRTRIMVVTSTPGLHWLFIVPLAIFIVLTVLFTLVLRCFLKRRASCRNKLSTVSEVDPIIRDLELGHQTPVPSADIAFDAERDWCQILKIRS